jgi:hypothetical protein
VSLPWWHINTFFPASAEKKSINLFRAMLLGCLPLAVVVLFTTLNLAITEGLISCNLVEGHIKRDYMIDCFWIG